MPHCAAGRRCAPAPPGGGVIMGVSIHRQGERQRWPAVLRQAQAAVADALAPVAANPGPDRQAYLDWLAGESAVCQRCAEAMEAVAGWHGRQPELHATAREWAAELRDLARLAATDVRALGGIASAPPRLLEEWRLFLEQASRCHRAGEALGAVALHAWRLPGRAGPALTALLGQPAVRTASGYLARRCRDDDPETRTWRVALLGAYSDTALAAGAQRAAAWGLAGLPPARPAP